MPQAQNAFPSAPPALPIEMWITLQKDTYLLTEAAPSPPAKLEVGENVVNIATTPDGLLLAVASFGAYDTRTIRAGYTEYWPKRESGSAVTLIKRPNNQILGRYPVPFRPRYLTFTPDGATLIIASFGQYSTNEKKRIPAQLCLLDVASGKLRNQVDLLQISDGYWFLPDEKRLVIPGWGISPPSTIGGKTRPQPELVTCDIITGAVERVTLSAAPGRWFDSGSEKMRYLTLESGVVAVGADGKLIGTTISAGDQNLFFVRLPDSRRFFLAGRSQKQGLIQVIEDGKVIKTFTAVEPGYVTFNADRSRIFLCAKGQGMILDAATLTELDRLLLPESFHDVQLSPDGKRLYIAELGDHVSVIDLESKKQLARFVTGRGGMKFLIGALAGLNDAMQDLNYRINRIQPQYTRLPVDIQSLAFSPSGNFVYVRNELTSDITVVETKGHTVVKKVATGLPEENRFIYQLAEGRRLISGSDGKLLIFDTEKGELLVERAFQNAKPFYDPTLGLIVVLGKTATEVWRPDPFEKIKDLMPGEKIIFKPEARRFVIFSEKTMSLYDYDLNLLREMDVELRRYQLRELGTDNLFVIPQPVAKSSEERKEEN